MIANSGATASGTVDDVLARLRGVRRNGDGWIALCPGHADREPSLSVDAGDDGRALLHCHAGCRPEDVLAAVGLTFTDLRGKGGVSIPPKTRATVQHPSGCTLAQYAEAKRLPVDYLRGLGLADFSYLGRIDNYAESGVRSQKRAWDGYR